MRTLCILEGCEVIQEDTGKVQFTADADIDADGSPHAYNPRDTGLDALANARDGREWCGIVTVGGAPYVAPSGFYVSTTAYQWPGKAVTDPTRYVDSEQVPFIVVSPLIRARAAGIVLGCKVRLTNLKNGRSVDAVVADIGPRSKIGEISIAAALAIGVPSSPRTGGESEHIIIYELWPGVAAVVNGVTYNLIPA